MNIDRKYKILGKNPVSGTVHTEEDSILFLAKDAAVPHMLEAYSRRCQELGCTSHHLKSVQLLHERVLHYQYSDNDGAIKIPDTTLEENTVFPGD